MRTMVVLGLAVALAGCATQFTGAAKVKNGPTGCKTACDGWGMELVGMVKMGEYSDGCICQARPGAPRASPGGPASTAPGDAGAPSADRSASERGGLAGLPAVTGVYLQMQAAAAAAAQQSAATRRSHESPGSPGWHPGGP